MSIILVIGTLVATFKKIHIFFVKVYLSKLDSMSDCTKNALWLYSRLRYQSRMLEKCPKNDLRTLKGDSANHLKIDRVDAKDLSIERFQVM